MMETDNRYGYSVVFILQLSNHLEIEKYMICILHSPNHIQS